VQIVLFVHVRANLVSDTIDTSEVDLHSMFVCESLWTPGVCEMLLEPTFVSDTIDTSVVGLHSTRVVGLLSMYVYLSLAVFF